MKTLVTGGAGFIGSHLSEKLLELGHDVLVLDDLSTGRIQNIEHLRRNKRFKFKKADISSNLKKIESYFKDIDWVFHLAALADIVPSISNPIKYHKANVNGTVNVLEASRINRVKRFIYTASSSCYGIAKQFPTPESAEISPQYPYALTKMVGENYVLHFGKVYQMPVVSLRLFNVYGPRSRTSGIYGAVFGVFLPQKLAGVPLTVVGTGNQRRDFVYVTDVIEAFIKAAKSNVENEVFNVGGGRPQSIKKLVNLIGGKIKYIPKRPGEPDMTYADISKIKKYLGWEHRVKFEDGVKIMIENINYWKDAPVWSAAKIKKATKEWFKYLGKK